MALSFNQATTSDIDALAELSLRSKSHWGYSKEYLQKCRPLFRFDEDYLSKWPVVKAHDKGELIGYYSLKNIHGENRLDNLWIVLPYIGKGYGKVMMERCLNHARQLGWISLRLAAEPMAVDFYKKFGAQKLGNVQSRIKSDLFLPHLEIFIEP